MDSINWLLLHLVCRPVDANPGRAFRTIASLWKRSIVPPASCYQLDGIYLWKS